MRRMLRDLRYAIRVLVKAPVFTITAVFTLALCIGANTAIFTVVDRLLLRPLPFPEADRLAAVVTRFEGAGGGEDAMGQTGAMWEALRDGTSSLDLAATTGSFGTTGVNMVAHGEPQYVQQQRVSAGYFRVLGIGPALGREFTAEEDRPTGPAVAILSDGLWRRAFGADAEIVGRTLTLRGEPYAIVGVMPPTFRSGAPVDVWTPARPWRRGEGGGQNYEIIARLKRGVSWSQADADVAAAGARPLSDLYRSPAGVTVRQHLVPLQQGETTGIREPLLILWGAVGVVLLIGCVNIAGLLLARSATRTGEVAIRIAIGASRTAIARQLFAESLIIAA